jgi:hypothetical protein
MIAGLGTVPFLTERIVITLKSHKYIIIVMILI